MKRFNSISTFSMLLLLLCSYSAAKSQDLKLHTIEVNTTTELHRFFQYTGNTPPIVSGHRGGKEDNLPENSIAAFENTLKHTPAFFEIDPRLSKDSVIVLMHDATLERTTTGRGNVSDYTLAELKELSLKDANGNVTGHCIPTLSEAIEWARGKTILSLDFKGVPYHMTSDLIEQHRAHAFVMVGIQNLKQAHFYLKQNKGFMFAIFIDSPAKLDEVEKAGIPIAQVMAYVGSVDKPENRTLYDVLHKKGIMCMVAAAPVYDKLSSKDERKNAYQQIIKNGVDIIESDLPIEVSAALQELREK